MSQARGDSRQTALSAALRMAGLTSAEAMQCALQADWAEAATAALKAQAMGGMLQRSGTAHASTMETQMVRLVSNARPWTTPTRVESAATSRPSGADPRSGVNEPPLLTITLFRWRV